MMDIEKAEKVGEELEKQREKIKELENRIEKLEKEQKKKEVRMHQCVKKTLVLETIIDEMDEELNEIKVKVEDCIDKKESEKDEEEKIRGKKVEKEERKNVVSEVKEESATGGLERVEKKEEQSLKKEETLEAEVDEWGGRTLLIRKGREWREEELEDWMMRRIGTRRYTLEKFSEDVAKIVLYEKEFYSKLWNLREAARIEGKYIIDKYLTREERAERYHLLQAIKKIKVRYREQGIVVDVEIGNKRARIEGTWYKWERESGKLKKIGKQDKQ